MNSQMAFGASFLASLATTPCAVVVAIRLGITDKPGPLKVQTAAVPYLGGLAMLLAIAWPLGVVRPVLLLPAGLAAGLGLVDDVAAISARVRLALEFAVGIISGLVVTCPPGGIFGVLLTALIVVGLVNAVNLIDGLDGLASGTALMVAVSFAIYGGGGRQIAFITAGALCGFLLFNRPPARIYLGDSGSYLLGVLIAILGVSALDNPGGATSWAVVPLFVAVPVLDTAVAITRRAIARRPLFLGDRSHVYDQLVDRGLGRGQSVLVMISLQACISAFGLLVPKRHSVLAFGVLGGVVFLLALVVVFGGFVTPVHRAGSVSPDSERSKE